MPNEKTYARQQTNASRHDTFPLTNPIAVAAAVRADAGILGQKQSFLDARGAHVLVTGASGMLGSYLALTFLAADRHFDLNLKVYGLSRDMSRMAGLYEGLPLVPLFRDVSRPLDDLPCFDYVIHAASPVGPALFASNPAGVAAANLRGTINLLEKAARDSCRRFLFVSTHEVYGSGRDIWGEDDKGVIDFLSPRACYPESKRGGENACICFHAQYGLHVAMARLARLIGPNMNLDSGLFVCDFLRDGLMGKPVTVRGNGMLVRPLLHVADAAAGVLDILFSGKAGEAYNVSPDRRDAPTISDVAEHVAALAGTTFVAPAAGDAGGTLQENAKLRALGWRQERNWREGLSDIWKALTA